MCFYRNARARHTHVEATLNHACAAQVRPVASSAARLALHHAPPGSAGSRAAVELVKLAKSLAALDADAVWLHCATHPSDADGAAAETRPPPLPSCAPLPALVKAPVLLDAAVKAEILAALDDTPSVLASAGLW